MKIRILVRRDRARGLVFAYCPDLPGCSATGPTRAEALGALIDRIEEHFRADDLFLPPDTRREELEI